MQDEVQGKDYTAVVIKRMPSLKLLLSMPNLIYVYESFRNFKVSVLYSSLLIRRSKFLNVNFLPKRCKTFIFLVVFQQSLFKITSQHVHFKYELV